MRSETTRDARLARRRRETPKGRSRRARVDAPPRGASAPGARRAVPGCMGTRDRPCSSSYRDRVADTSSGRCRASANT
jgi:hypothetical protein